MMNKNKGFTLVELLAVIVILAIIALIATPIILNVINDAKKQAAKDSAHGYVDAVDKYIVSSELEDESIPDRGSIEIENGSVKSYELEIDGYLVSNGEVGKVSITKKFENGTVVYYNPVSGEKCKSSEEGCMKWYVFNDEEGNATVNVILDHNTTAKVVWNSTGNNSEMKEVKRKLEEDTKDWKNTARLITANEVAKITGNTGFDANKENQSWFFLDSNNQTQIANSTNKSKYAWLFDYTMDCTNYGCNKSDLSTLGYWTTTTKTGTTGAAWCVGSHGDLGTTVVGLSGFGIRPVITISKSNV